jgi:hypothetical protein
LFILSNFSLVVYDCKKKKTCPFISKAYKVIFFFAKVEEIYAHFGDSIVLKKINFNDKSLTRINLRWLFNHQLNNQTITDEDVKITLDNLNLFGVYTLQNKVNGAFVSYRVICNDAKCLNGKQYFLNTQIFYHIFLFLQNKIQENQSQ